MTPKIKPSLLVAALLSILSCNSVSQETSNEKIRGVSFVAPRSQIGARDIISVKTINANWVALMPFAYCDKAGDSLTDEYHNQWWGEKEEGVDACVKLFHEQGQQVMIKPQIWIGHAFYTGDFQLESEEKWVKWSESYLKYILKYARIAERNNIDMLCIGTELKQIIHNHPEFWIELITKVRMTYHGKLTYAANWDNYKNIPFWSALDYIGIDAYFPLLVQGNLNENKLIEAWQPHKKEIKLFSESHNKQIIFTEVGYRSIDGATFKPWESGNTSVQENEQVQQLAYEALFRSFWEEEWFKGVFIWKWFHHHEELNNSRYTKGFTPQKKLAQEKIKEWYEK